MFRIAIIGAGNVAWHLASNLEKEGHQITEVYSRNLANAKALARTLWNAKPTNSLDFSHSQASIFLVCVSDNALQEVIEQIALPEEVIIAHTSGTHSLEILERANAYIGVFYPLQTFTKDKEVNFKNVPICLEANEAEVLEVLIELAESISSQVYEISTPQRQVLHLSAVFACNFTNFLFTISKEILERNEMPFDLLQNLIQETVQKAFVLSPENAQTGPAKRGDTSIVEKHLTLLESYPVEWKVLYELFTQQIRAYYQNIT
ncbi:Rossmann-like and DUF2520 domain-containing protein [Thermoflexibacter ruber]|uniref:Predicted oxidoreductase, contains short-chain dehydrogenase (SDR) and DUF2520 domains n=1 Tax=Thermoflexibacter ruber TaxID=1003 RepID=A0A1I2I918_9BACT|nr:Rossmann-like and DUF2520 domain-containing protein [Thermoflexibacter ruber]SFF38859.1 Predicted oxidoreductase, contains short-chain dehydrogenase (SDR) and DUF2520 domains [Thermoflexibacter ruber]